MEENNTEHAAMKIFDFAKRISNNIGVFQLADNV